MSDQNEEWENIQKGWLNTGQEQRYYASQGAGILGVVILVILAHIYRKFF